MRKFLFLTVLFFLIAIQVINAQINVTMFIDGKAFNPDTFYPLCKDSCYNISLSVSGGTPPYSYEWDNGMTNDSAEYCFKDLFNFSNADTIKVFVRDSKNEEGYCEQRLTDRLYINQQICIVTVDSATNKNMIIWEQSTDANVTSYNIYKETTVSDEYEFIGNVDKGKMSVHIDTSSNPAKVSARYIMKAANGCAESEQSSPTKTMHLTINKGLENTWNLIWEKYEGIVVGLKNKIWRGSTSEGLQKIDSVASSATTYTDLNPPAGILFYAIEMIPANKCNPTEKNAKKSYSTSFSNIADNKDAGIDELTNDNLQLRISPNPTGQITNIKYQIPNKARVAILVYDIMGREIKQLAMNIEQLAGKHEVKFDMSGVEKGIYFVKLEVNGFGVVRKVAKY